MFFPSYSESSKFGEIAILPLMLLQNCVYDPSIIYLYLYHIIIYTIHTILFYKWEASKVKVERRNNHQKLNDSFSLQASIIHQLFRCKKLNTNCKKIKQFRIKTSI